MRQGKSDDLYDLIVVGGGAAGFFGAINAAMLNPSLKILILEKTTKLLAKVRVSGGGRCNVTHRCLEASTLSKHYPRGQKELRKLFHEFQAKDTIEWFHKAGVELKAEEDGRMFPATNSSETIIHTFLRKAEEYKIQIKTSEGVSSLEKQGELFRIKSDGGSDFFARFVLISIGGHPQSTMYDWIRKMGHSVIPPIPSLFTFNDSEKKFTDLMGVAVVKASVKIAGTKFIEEGPVLITHWGLSGPAVIKLSAWAAEYLHEKKYDFTVLVNWTGRLGEEDARGILQELKEKFPKKKIIANPLFDLPSRLWSRLCLMADFDERMPWGEAPQKKINRLIELLIRCAFQIKGKTTFKEEFVTCGGVDWKNIELKSMESKVVPGLYFAGEVIHADGETGGFNFQAAWTTAFVAARSIATK